MLFHTVIVILTAAISVVDAADVRVVTTFECAGVYWKPKIRSLDGVCSVRYRETGASEWREGFPLWYDGRVHEWGGEFRGSLVHLRAGTEYEVQLRAGDESAQARFRTWPDQFPSGRRHALPRTVARPLVITESGTAQGYAVYEPKFQKTTIDVGNHHANCIRIENASHIIVRGLSLVHAETHAIELVGDVHDIVIEDCDISAWGRIDPDGWGHNNDSAVFSRSESVERIVVQNNRIHHPRGDANSWNELRATRRDANNRHPVGPQAILFAHSRGNHVIRRNMVRSDDDHQFNDIFGASANYSTVGFPNCDSDIYANTLSHCWDDAIESEGANRNVRIWGNFSEKAFVHVATATTSVGPLYVWRNVVGETRKSNEENPDRSKRGGFLKTSDRLGGGRIYVFHNTLLQPDPPQGFRNTLGCQVGLGHGGAMRNIVSRNNIFHTSLRGGPFNDRTKDPSGDYDFDLYNGRLLLSNHEMNGVTGRPKYEPLPTIGSHASPFTLSRDSPGIDVGQRLPNFNDNFRGKAPDMGAHEQGSSPPN